jgi:hypothetical protein
VLCERQGSHLGSDFFAALRVIVISDFLAGAFLGGGGSRFWLEDVLVVLFLLFLFVLEVVTFDRCVRL